MEDLEGYVIMLLTKIFIIYGLFEAVCWIICMVYLAMVYLYPYATFSNLYLIATTLYIVYLLSYNHAF